MVDLAQKVFEALQEPTVPGRLERSRSPKIPDNAQLLGVVPDHLRKLYVLCKKMAAAQSAEEHRRCVAFFDKEDYDHEIFEFMTYQEVRADPNFGGDGAVRALFDWSIQLHFPALPMNEWGAPLYHIDDNWDLYSAPIKARAQ